MRGNLVNSQLISCVEGGNKLVYVDDANVSRYGRGWFHLTADSLEELHVFADSIGVPFRAFHRGARHPHYDISVAQRLNALRSGARPVTSREIVRIAAQLTVPMQVVVHSTSDDQLALFI